MISRTVTQTRVPSKDIKKYIFIVEFNRTN